MKLYLAWASTGVSFFDKLWDYKNKCNFLETYIYFNKKKPINLIKRLWKPIFLDSWAFSAFTLWKNINILDYCNFIKNNISLFETYAWLDVIGDGDKTLENINFMRDQWLNPLPTYHYWTSIKYFEYYIHQYEYIWIWWMVPLARKPDEIRRLLDYVFWYIRKHKLKTKIHWWWMTNPRFMAKYPFYSVDSTWRLAWWKFKTILFFDKVNGTLSSNNASNIRKQLWIDRWKLHYADINNHNIKSLYDYTEFIDNLHSSKGMKYREDFIQ